ncbi:type IV pilus assembly protein PilM [Halomonas almeriensis]|uniref:type IV pilus biogenesis protein PilM n=1 Tax=Halomonas almeriensis TaxID=308163 RepID=UPI0025B387CC|nr:type IV pilus assembly protein PilM [Halomonas almeriensis]MDN3553358.1 type IV pilus assembly protein PilM [Halomonas almeriensis]
MLKRNSAACGRLGIDIGPDAVKLVELSTSRRGREVRGHDVAPLPRGAVHEGRIHDETAVLETLSGALARAGVRVQCASVAVPAEASIIKTLPLPAALNEEELEWRLRLDSDQHIPFPFPQVAFDFQSLGPLDDDADQQAVLLVACHRQVVEQRAELLRRAGLRPVAVDIETFAMERALTRLAPARPPTDDTCALLDIGREAGTFHVLHRGRAVYRQDIPLPWPEGEPIETGASAWQSADVEALASQLARALQLHASAGLSPPVGLLWLSGSISGLRQLADDLSEAMALRVVMADPLRPLACHAGVDDEALRQVSPSLLVACGLALRGDT